jgi:hypothetical protein
MDGILNVTGASSPTSPVMLQLTNINQQNAPDPEGEQAEEQRRLLRDPQYASATADLVHRRAQLTQPPEAGHGPAAEPGNGEPPAPPA